MLTNVVVEGGLDEVWVDGLGEGGNLVGPSVENSEGVGENVAAGEGALDLFLAVGFGILENFEVGRAMVCF